MKSAKKISEVRPDPTTEAAGFARNVNNDPLETKEINDMKRGYSCIGLDNPKDVHNMGAVLRAARCFGCGLVATTGQRYRRACTDTMAAYRHLPLLQVDDLHTLIPFDCVPVAVEIVEGARPLTGYTHPERAFYVFGAEDATLGQRVLSWCRDVVYIPTNGCLNLAACVNVVLYDRFCKRGGDQ